MRTLDELGISPAPWSVDRICNTGKPCVTREVWDSSLGMTHLEVIAKPKNEADARLIAAAPMLYEAVRQLLEVCDKNCEWNKWAHDVYEQGRAALAAASGESEARVWCKHDSTRKCVDCEGCPDESDVNHE